MTGPGATTIGAIVTTGPTAPGDQTGHGALTGRGGRIVLAGQTGRTDQIARTDPIDQTARDAPIASAGQPLTARPDRTFSQTDRTAAAARRRRLRLTASSRAVHVGRSPDGRPRPTYAAFINQAKSPSRIHMRLATI